MGAIENYITDLQTRLNLYELNWVNPYGSAYSTAYDKFKETLASQEKHDAMKLELFLTFATIGMGAGMGAMFGKAAFKAVVADQALNFVCNRNMNRMFNAMARVSASVPGTYIVDQSWDAVAGLIGTQSKALVSGLFTQAGASSGISAPLNMQNDLKNYVLRIQTAAARVAEDLRDSNASQAQKDKFANDMRNSVFFKNAPTRQIIPGNAAETIELSWYMVMATKTDFIQEHTVGFQGTREVNRYSNVGSINVPTTASNYGAMPAGKHSSGLGYSTSTSYSIAYKDLGSKVLDRINELYKKREKEDFIPNAWYQSGDTTAAALVKAERMLDKINLELASGT